MGCLQAACFYAYFAPYHYEMHVDLIAELQTHPEVKLHTLGMTTDGHDMDLLQIGTPHTTSIDSEAACEGQPGPGKPKLWAIAWQHLWKAGPSADPDIFAASRQLKRHAQGSRGPASPRSESLLSSIWEKQDRALIQTYLHAPGS